MSINQVLNGQIQLPQSNIIQTSVQTPAQTTVSQVVSSVNISPVNNTIDPSLYIYDGQTTLYINSTVNQTNNSVRLKYFDPVTGYPNLSGSASAGAGFSNWNFDLTSQNYLLGNVSSSNLLGEDTSMYENLQPPFSTPNFLGTYSLDITNNNQLNDSSGNSYKTLFFSLTSQPYLSYQGVMYNSPGEIGIPTADNIKPNYSSLGTDTFLFTSQYWTQTNNEILLIYMVFSVANTSSTYYNGGSSSYSSTPAPVVTVNVYNKVISKEMLASIGTGNSCPKPKVYSSGIINLNYLPTGQSFSSGTATYFLYNNVPIVLADGFGKQFATFGLFYIPPNSNSEGQYLKAGVDNLLVDGGYTIKSYLPTGNTATGIGTISSSSSQYGYFVVGVTYSYNASQYSPGTSFSAQVLVKNIWRSPIAIYSSYSAYSVNDLTNKQVVLLFGRTSNGGSFLVTNTGTPLAQITNYGITSLGNFMSIMKTLLISYNNSYTLADYFTNTTLISILNGTLGSNLIAVSLQCVLEGTIINPVSVLNCPNMWYMFINSKNSSNLSVDPTYQNVFNSDSSLYFGLPSSTLCDTGLCKYFNSELLMIGTDKNVNNIREYFGNSLYLGLNTINGQSYYMLLILPEALFNGIPLNSTNNTISIYSTDDTIFYFMINQTTSSAFVPTSNTITNSTSSSSSTVSGTVNSTYNISKIILPVSNVQLI